MRPAGGSPGVMSILSRRRARRSLDPATAERLLAGRGVPGGCPAARQALARALEVASGPGTARELADEVAAVATFVQVTSQAGSRRLARRAMAAAACAIAVGGSVAYGALAPGDHRAAPAQFGVPAPSRAVPPAPAPRAAPGTARLHPEAPRARQAAHPAFPPSVPSYGGGRR